MATYEESAHSLCLPSAFLVESYSRGLSRRDTASTAEMVARTEGSPAEKAAVDDNIAAVGVDGSEPGAGEKSTSSSAASVEPTMPSGTPIPWQYKWIVLVCVV